MGEHFNDKEEKLTFGMIIAGIVIICILVTTLVVYLVNVNKTNDEVIEEEIGQVNNSTNKTESVSTQMGKTVNEASNELNTTTNNTTVENTTTNTTNTESNKKATNTSGTKNNTKTNTVTNTNTTTKQAETKEENKEIKFSAPIKGEIIRDCTPDSLVYSNTLEEWITHVGVDIKADKTSVVTAAADGEVYSIKNDPRYGLTVIINHENGYQTVYSNLLTAEYVVEGEKVKAGQTIGTVGNSATFEIADDYHLHFELIKDGDYVNPNNYMEF